MSPGINRQGQNHFPRKKVNKAPRIERGSQKKPTRKAPLFLNALNITPLTSESPFQKGLSEPLPKAKGKIYTACVHAHAKKCAHAHAIRENLMNFRTVGIDFSNFATLRR